MGFTGGFIIIPIKFTGDNGWFYNPRKSYWCKSTRKKYIKWARWVK